MAINGAAVDPESPSQMDGTGKSALGQSAQKERFLGPASQGVLKEEVSIDEHNTHAIHIAEGDSIVDHDHRIIVNRKEKGKSGTCHTL